MSLEKIIRPVSPSRLSLTCDIFSYIEELLAIDVFI